MDNRKIILFGSGEYGKKALNFFRKDKVEYFLDNNKDKHGKEIDGIKIISFDEYLKIKDDYNVVISVYLDKVKILSDQLDKYNIKNYFFYQEFVNDIKNPYDKNKNTDLNLAKEKALDWIEKNTVENEGIIISSKLKKSYPEVSGYYIPTLIRYNKIDLAKQYASYLVSIQNKSGAWSGYEEKEDYVFDTGQILKGLVAIYKYMPEVKYSIKRAADYLIGRIDEKGEMKATDETVFETGVYSNLIHIYCISPLYEAGKILNDKSYSFAADKTKNYYINERIDDILNFNLLSHFYAYVMEALTDLNEYSLAKKAMDKILKFRKKNGFFPAYNNVDWTCSTGLFQLAIVWYKLGEKEIADKTFEYGLKLQNETGGWFGSYPVIDNPRPNDIKNYPTYKADEEISWAVKYFLDAIYFRKDN